MHHLLVRVAQQIPSRVHNLANSDVPMQNSKVNLGAQRDVSGGYVGQVPAERRVPRLDRARYVLEPFHRVGALPLPPELVERGVVEIEERI